MNGPDNISIQDRILGCFLGGAVGDALGAPLEFLDWSEIVKKYGPSGVNYYQLAYGRKGAITDDTQMTLFTAEALIRAQNRFEAKGICSPVGVIKQAYYRWYLTQGELPPVHESTLRYLNSGWLVTNEFLHQKRAPGRTVMKSLGDKNNRFFADNNSKGCGGVMRVAPIGLIAINPFDLAVDATKITHGHPTGFLSAGVFALIISNILNGKSLSDAIEDSLKYLIKYPSHEETYIAVAKAVDLAKSASLTNENIESLGQGWVAEEALSIAIFCALLSPDFESGVIAAVNHSGDCDSTGAICGNILGAIHGSNAIADKFLNELEGYEVIKQLASDFTMKFFIDPNAEACSRGRYPGN